MGSKNRYHQDGVPVEKYKFDKDADSAATAGIQPLFNTDGQQIVMSGTHKARMRAQMGSHKKPSNRAR